MWRRKHLFLLILCSFVLWFNALTLWPDRSFIHLFIHSSHSLTHPLPLLSFHWISCNHAFTRQSSLCPPAGFCQFIPPQAAMAVQCVHVLSTELTHNGSVLLVFRLLPWQPFTGQHFIQVRLHHLKTPNETVFYIDRRVRAPQTGSSSSFYTSEWK